MVRVGEIFDKCVSFASVCAHTEHHLTFDLYCIRGDLWEGSVLCLCIVNDRSWLLSLGGRHQLQHWVRENWNGEGHWNNICIYLALGSNQPWFYVE